MEDTTMSRQPIGDDGTWFDPEKANQWEEETEWDGRNHISLATGSQWDHQQLFHTAGGKWVLHHWSQWQGSRPSWELITAKDAAAWLIRNKHDVPAELKSTTAALEV